MSKTLFAFSTFRDNLQNKIQHSNGDESFNARIIYSWKRQTKQETLKVTLNLTSFEYGRIRIEDGVFLNCNTVHMDFNPNFQEYRLSEEGFLIIKGTSPKVGGLYEVKIFEV
jgi:hypothetical protein